MKLLIALAAGALGYGTATYRHLRRQADSGCGCVDHRHHKDCKGACPCVYWQTRMERTRPPELRAPKVERFQHMPDGSMTLRAWTAEERDHGGGRGFADAS